LSRRRHPLTRLWAWWEIPVSRETGLARDYACVPRETTDLV